VKVSDLKIPRTSRSSTDSNQGDCHGRCACGREVRETAAADAAAAGPAEPSHQEGQGRGGGCGARRRGQVSGREDRGEGSRREGAGWEARQGEGWRKEVARRNRSARGHRPRQPGRTLRADTPQRWIHGRGNFPDRHGRGGAARIESGALVAEARWAGATLLVRETSVDDEPVGPAGAGALQKAPDGCGGSGDRVR